MSQGDWGQNHAQEKRTTSSPGVQQTILEHAVEITVTVHTQAGKQQKMKDLLLHDK